MQFINEHRAKIVSPSKKHTHENTRNIMSKVQVRKTCFDIKLETKPEKGNVTMALDRSSHVFQTIANNPISKTNNVMSMIKGRNYETITTHNKLSKPAPAQIAKFKTSVMDSLENYYVDIKKLITCFCNPSYF